MHLPRRQPPRRAKNRKSGRAGSKRRGVPDIGAPVGGTGVALVVGLGNPGRRYRYTRHNLGRVAAESIVENSELIARGKWPDGRLALVSLGGVKFLVLEPETFMNLSGRAVAPVMERYGIEPGRTLVIHDDIDIPLGDVKLKRGGGTAGHRGLASLVQAIGESGFARVRIGVGRPPEGVDPADYVLDSFGEAEKAQALLGVRKAVDAAFAEVTGENRDV